VTSHAGEGPAALDGSEHVLDLDCDRGRRADAWHTDVTFIDRPRRLHRVTVAGGVPISVDGRRSVARTGDATSHGPAPGG
jgi:hypothetical protein